MQYRLPKAELDSSCQTVSIVTGNNGCRHMSVVTPGRLCPSVCAHGWPALPQTVMLKRPGAISTTLVDMSS